MLAELNFCVHTLDTRQLTIERRYAIVTEKVPVPGSSISDTNAN